MVVWVKKTKNSVREHQVVILLFIGALLYSGCGNQRVSVSLDVHGDYSHIPSNVNALSHPKESNVISNSLIGDTKSAAMEQQDQSTSQNHQDYSPLRHNVTTQSIVSLKAKMDLYYSDLQKELRGTKNAQARQVLRILAEANMVPTLPKVPITREILPYYRKISEAQEKEDVFVYEHFYNEETKKCHTFGTHMFESGALNGFTYSNTFMLEKYFQEKVILVEALDYSFRYLRSFVKYNRTKSEIHHAALCPVGTQSVCIGPNGANTRARSMHRVVDSSASNCANNPTPCLDFDESIHYSFFSLDIEGFELEFLKMRKPKADIIMIEVIQWARYADQLFTLIQLVAYMADIGYYLYEETIGFRNFAFLSRDLVNDCSDLFGNSSLRK